MGYVKIQQSACDLCSAVMRCRMLVYVVGDACKDQQCVLRATTECSDE